MAVALIAQSTNASTTPSGTSATIAITSSVAGSLLVLVIHVQSSSVTVTGVTDSGGGTWTKAVDLSTSGSYTAVWYLANAPAGITSVTATESAGTAYSASVSQWSGVATSNPVRVTNSTAVAASPNRTGAVITSPGDLVVGGISANSATARTLSSTGWAALADGALPSSFSAKQAYIVSAGATEEGQWTTGSASNTGGTVAAFIPAAGGTTVAGTAALAAAGTLAASGGLTVPGNGALTAAGTLTASALVFVPATASLTGTGSLSASSGSTATGTASLAGSGSLTATPTLIVSGVATLAAASTVTATVQLIRLATASLTGQGSLSAVSGSALNGSASLAGSGSLSAAAAVLVPATAVLAGAGSLTATGGGLVSATTVLSGAGSLTATLNSRITYRPEIGTVVRPGIGTTTRPATGTSARSSTGATTRPYTGITSRP